MEVNSEKQVERQYAENDEPFIGIKKLSEWLDVSVWTIRNTYLKAGMPRYRYNSIYKFRKSEVAEWLKENNQ